MSYDFTPTTLTPAEYEAHMALWRADTAGEEQARHTVDQFVKTLVYGFNQLVAAQIKQAAEPQRLAIVDTETPIATIQRVLEAAEAEEGEPLTTRRIAEIALHTTLQMYSIEVLVDAKAIKAN